MAGLDFSLEPGIFTLAAGFVVAIVGLFAAAFIISGTSPFAKAEGRHKHKKSEAKEPVSAASKAKKAIAGPVSKGSPRPQRKAPSALEASKPRPDAPSPAPASPAPAVKAASSKPAEPKTADAKGKKPAVDQAAGSASGWADEHGHEDEWNVAISRKNKAKFARIAAEKADQLDGFTHAHAHHIDHTKDASAAAANGADVDAAVARSPSVLFEDDASRRYDQPSFFSVLEEESVAGNEADSGKKAKAVQTPAAKATPQKGKRAEKPAKPALVHHETTEGSASAAASPEGAGEHGSGNGGFVPPPVRRSVSFSERIKTIAVPTEEQ